MKKRVLPETPLDNLEPKPEFICSPSHSVHGSLGGGAGTSSPSSFQSASGSDGKILRAGSIGSRSVPKWQVELTRILTRLCKAIEARRARGQTFRQALKQPVWYWSKPRFFRNDKTRRVRLSRGSIIRWYYLWKASGPETFTLNYIYGADRLGAARLDKFIETAISSGASSYRQAYQALHDTSVSGITYRDALAPRTRARLSTLFRLRRKAAYTVRMIRRESGRK